MLKLNWTVWAAVAIAAVYLAFLTRTYYWDGVLFSIYMENAAQGVTPIGALVHPNHLLYTVLGFAVYSAISMLGIHARAITVLQVLDAAASAGAAYVMFRFALRLVHSRTVAIFCMILFAAGATWWKFSTDADPYTVAVLCEVLACYFALRERPRWALAAAFHVIGMLIHELAVFVYVPALAAIWLQSSRRVKSRVVGMAAYVAASSAIVAGAYLLGFSFADHRTYPTLAGWLTSYSGAHFTNSVGQLVTAYLASYTKLFVGGRLSLVRQYFSVVLCCGLLVAIVALAWAAVSFQDRRREMGEPADHRSTKLLWSWFIPYAIFLALFDPGSTFHKLFIWPAVVLLLGAYASRTLYLREHARALVALAIVVAGWNFAAFIYPHAHASADPVLVLAREINRKLPRNATVYYAAFSPDDWYLQYFAPGRQWLALPTDVVGIAKQTEPVCLETTALDHVQQGLGLELAIDPERRWDLITAQHNLRFECLK